MPEHKPREIGDQVIRPVPTWKVKVIVKKALNRCSFRKKKSESEKEIRDHEIRSVPTWEVKVPT